MARKVRLYYGVTGRHGIMEERRWFKLVKVDQMDSRALTVTAKKVLDNHPGEEFQVFIVWKCKILKNWKYLVSSTVEDGRYYELTYNGEKGEWYVDTYIKVRNESLTSETIDRMEV